MIPHTHTHTDIILLDFTGCKTTEKIIFKNSKRESQCKRDSEKWKVFCTKEFKKKVTENSTKKYNFMPGNEMVKSICPFDRECFLRT